MTRRFDPGGPGQPTLTALERGHPLTLTLGEFRESAARGILGPTRGLADDALVEQVIAGTRLCASVTANVGRVRKGNLIVSRRSSPVPLHQTTSPHPLTAAGLRRAHDEGLVVYVDATDIRTGFATRGYTIAKDQAAMDRMVRANYLPTLIERDIEFGRLFGYSWDDINHYLHRNTGYPFKENLEWSAGQGHKMRAEAIVFGIPSETLVPEATAFLLEAHLNEPVPLRLSATSEEDLVLGETAEAEGYSRLALAHYRSAYSRVDQRWRVDTDSSSFPAELEATRAAARLLERSGHWADAQFFYLKAAIFAEQGDDNSLKAAVWGELAEASADHGDADLSHAARVHAGTGVEKPLGLWDIAPSGDGVDISA